MSNKGVNKVILVGHMGQDPDVRHSADGRQITNISIATSEEWKDKSGNKQAKTEWHRVVFFGKLAEIAGEYLRKGSQVYIEGKLQTRKWQDKGGVDKYSTEVIVDSFNGVMQMLGGKQEGQERTVRGGIDRTPQQQKPTSQNVSVPEDGFDNNFDDDIPF